MGQKAVLQRRKWLAVFSVLLVSLLSVLLVVGLNSARHPVRFAYLTTTNGHYLYQSGTTRINAGTDNVTVYVFTNDFIGLNIQIDPELIKTLSYENIAPIIHAFTFKAPETVGKYHFKVLYTTDVVADFSIIADRIIIGGWEIVSP